MQSRVVAKLHRHWRLLTLVAALVIAILAATVGFVTPFERVLQPLRQGLRPVQASGTLHIVEIDARSIAAIDRWPWPRGNYALLVDRLRAAGAASIVFDVDFSSPSTPSEDAALAAALKRAGGRVTLPTFRQPADARRTRWIDSLPAAPLRDHAMLAAVSVLPDGDGVVRRAPIGTVTDGVPRPSLSALLGDRSGAVDESFPIDFAIDPATIPRHSFVDLRDGLIGPGVLAGKDVLIGATAIELGDRYAVPRHGVIPGVVIQALAAETLKRGKPVELPWSMPLLLALVLGALVLRGRGAVQVAGASIAGIVAVFAMAVIGETWLVWMPIMPALVALLVASGAASAGLVFRELRRRRAEDGETGLPNRVALRAAITGQNDVWIAAAHIENFDRLAASLGPEHCADLVTRLCERLRFAAVDAAVYRIEDRVLAWRLDDEAELEAHFDALRALMLNPVEAGGRRVDVALRFGVASGPARDSDAITAKASLAAAQAAASGAKWLQHEAASEADLDRELSLMGELEQALIDGHVIVYYQPKLDIARGAVCGVEALVRWQHPQRGFMRPDLFIPLAEQSDHIANLTLYVIERTLADLAAWGARGYPISGAVNISAKLLTSANFTTALRALIASSSVPTSRLTFEVTESATMADPEGAIAALKSFRDLGIAISMDDYGTGQSTLTYIRQLPLAELKIDRSFVQFAHQNRSDGILVRSTIDLAHELGIKVVAEGVEDEGCLAFLRSVGCDIAQGYLIGKPMPADALIALVEGHRKAA